MGAYIGSHGMGAAVHIGCISHTTGGGQGSGMQVGIGMYWGQGQGQGGGTAFFTGRHAHHSSRARTIPTGMISRVSSASRPGLLFLRGRMVVGGGGSGSHRVGER